MRFLDLFAGIGGFHLGLSRAGHECAGAVEWDRHARAVYAHHWPDAPLWHDATKVFASELPDHDILCGGFPCQPFSVAGKRAGIDDARGTLFYDIARIAKARRPRYLLLENVPGLLSSEGGDTFAGMLRALDAVGYDAGWQVLRGEDWLPQARHRLWIVGVLRGGGGREVLPLAGPRGGDTAGRRAKARPERIRSGKFSFKDIRVGGDAMTLMARERGGGAGAENTGLYAVKSKTFAGRENIILGDRARTLMASRPGHECPSRGLHTGFYAVPFSGMHKNGHGQHTRGDGKSFTLSTWKEDACVATGGAPATAAEARRMIRAGEMRVRRLTPLECERVQGFPDNWTRVDGVPEGARYRLVGNSVMPPIVEFLGGMLA